LHAEPHDRLRASRARRARRRADRGDLRLPVGTGDAQSVAVTNIATAATVITAALAQPSVRSQSGFRRSPMTAASLVRRTTSTISGGARTPFTTADQKSIATASKP